MENCRYHTADCKTHTLTSVFAYTRDSISRCCVICVKNFARYRHKQAVVVRVMPSFWTHTPHTVTNIVLIHISVCVRCAYIAAESQFVIQAASSIGTYTISTCIYINKYLYIRATKLHVMQWIRSSTYIFRYCTMYGSRAELCQQEQTKKRNA